MLSREALEALLFWTILVGVPMLILGTYFYQKRRAQKRREMIAATPVSHERRAAIRRGVPLLDRLPTDVWEDLLPLVQVFQNQVSWEACGDLEAVTSEMRDIISAQACLLVVRNGQPLYPALKSVLIYPASYRAKGRNGERDQTRLGESWDSGSIVLSWRGVVSSSKDGDDGFNLVIHEFSHQLDQINGGADGLPVLRDREDLEQWAEAFSEGYEDYCERVESGENVDIDDYAATNEAEFFAVLSEVFFERPDILKSEYSEIYDAMTDYYALDPLAW